LIFKKGTTKKFVTVLYSKKMWGMSVNCQHFLLSLVNLFAGGSASIALFTLALAIEAIIKSEAPKGFSLAWDG